MARTKLRDLPVEKDDVEGYGLLGATSLTRSGIKTSGLQSPGIRTTGVQVLPGVQVSSYFDIRNRLGVAAG